MRRIAPLFVGLCVIALACSGEGYDEGDFPEDGPAVGSEPGVYTLNAIEQGDTACYLFVSSSDGENMDFMADFDLCPGGGSDASGKIGHMVRFTTVRESVMAASCQGDPDCPNSEQVDLVTSITLVN